MGVWPVIRDVEVAYEAEFDVVFYEVIDKSCTKVEVPPWEIEVA